MLSVAQVYFQGSDFICEEGQDLNVRSQPTPSLFFGINQLRFDLIPYYDSYFITGAASQCCLCVC